MAFGIREIEILATSSGGPFIWASTRLRCTTLFRADNDSESPVIELNDKALKRRAKELHSAANLLIEEESRALLLFYAAECGLKAIYMQNLC